MSPIFCMDQLNFMDTHAPRPRLDSRSILGMRVHANSIPTRSTALPGLVPRESRYACRAPVHMFMEMCDSSEYKRRHQWRRPRYAGSMAALHGLKVGFYGGTENSVELLLSELARMYSRLKRRLFLFASRSKAYASRRRKGPARDRNLRGADIIRPAGMSQTGEVDGGTPAGSPP
jgi:hypothetical protein